VAVACGAVLTVLPFPATPPKPGVPLLRDVTVAGRRVPVFVAPGRPGWNLVHVGADRASVGMDRQRLAPASARPGTTQLWATVWMPAGRGRLWIGYRGATAALPFDTGRRGPAGVDLRGPDGPECASVALGRVIAGVDTPLRSCPSGALSDSDADALTAMVRFIAGRGVHALALVGDVSARGVRATAYVRAAAGRFGLSVLDLGTASPRRSGDEGRVPVAVVSGWAGADGVVQAVSRGRLVAEGVYLAPWLLNAPLLAPAAGQLIPLRFHPGDPPALRYIAALNRRFPGDEATQAGFLGWSSRVAGVTAPLRLYAASRIFVPGGIGPLSLDHGGHGAGHWLPDGAVVPITGPLNRI
jgi:hypothetical protein